MPKTSSALFGSAALNRCFDVYETVYSLTVNSINVSALFNSLLETRGGADGEYNIYVLTLPSWVYASLGSGSTVVTWKLAGPVQTPQLPILGPGSVEDPNNGAFLIYSTLEMTTNEVPEPGSILGGGLGLAVILARRRTGARSAA
ncbi:MAG: PEP-CTERM sorting domain-containing protein [Bryobacter sp.]|jgi:hypothetical protein|nr:PEP-CTERM sorting domain-containing protein [Bryobacter sp. CoA8 C33]